MKILLLHGALGASSQMLPLQKLFSSFSETFLLDFSGHGGKDFGENFSIKAFAGDVIHFLDKHSIDKIHVFGYSMGGYVGLYLSRNFPDRIANLMTVATKMDWTPESSAKEVKMLNPETVEQKVPAFAAELRQRHSPADWKVQMQKTAEMMLEMGDNPPVSADDLKSVSNKVLMCVGDRDKMVSVEETLAAYRMIPNGSCWVIPMTAHPVEKLPIDLIAASARDFFGH